jgi:hypothetical protein
VFRTTTTRTDQGKDAVAAGTGKVTDSAAELKVKAAEAASATAAGAASARVRAADAAEAARETAGTAKVKAVETAEVVREKAQEAAETLAPKVEQAREAFVDDVLPKIAGAIAAVAAGAAAAKESAVEAADRAPDAYAVLKGDAVAKKGNRGTWLLVLGALAAGAAVVAWRRSNERPDPWASAGTYVPPKSATEKVSELAGAAKEKAADVKDTVVEKAGGLKDKAADAKDSASDRVDDLKDAGADLEAQAAADGVADDSADAVWADANVADDSVASTSGTSEGSDLSTPNLDAGTPLEGDAGEADGNKA